ncbi:IniB N-terminal domain-containing protein [Amycolatopsis aidingensis]|uniref:IniB N-terminal domain-containing protein n=1 Tax=Amycolatopsis aidingensis TaxID=2842453 RepID=UPI001C0BF5F8|nr:IniB N-terminal domain-containing protein [Amycolatopsis aidingensis]
MQNADQTLHDFVLNLLTDATARSCFAEDPAGTLAGAGLSDVTAQDVQEVVPLVLDYAQLPAPVPGIDSLDGAGLPTEGAADAIAQLRAVAEAAGAPDVGSFTLSGEGSADGFTGVGSVRSETFEAGADADLTGSLSGVAGGVSGGTAEAGAFQANAAAGADGVTAGGEFGNAQVVGNGHLAASTDGVSAGFELAGTGFSVEGSGAGNTEEFAVGGSTMSPLGDYGFESAGEFGELGDLDLDTEALGRGGEAAGGTVATYVSSGGQAFADGVSTGAETVSGQLEDAGAGEAADAVRTGAETVSGQVSSATAEVPRTDDLTGGLDDLPATEVPDTGDLPELPELPELPDLAGRLPGELPELPVANPLPDVDLPETDPTAVTEQVTDTVTDTVGDSPLGQVTQQGADLPNPSGIADDLSLGG